MIIHGQLGSFGTFGARRRVEARARRLVAEVRGFEAVDPRAYQDASVRAWISRLVREDVLDASQADEALVQRVRVAIADRDPVAAVTAAVCDPPRWMPSQWTETETEAETTDTATVSVYVRR